MPNTVVKMPQLGESVVEGTIGRWLKSPGDRVERDEPLVEIQTDKVNAEVASPVAGILQQILLPEGATVAVTTDMAIIGDEQVSAESVSGEAPAPAPPAFSYDTASVGVGVVGSRDEDPPTPDTSDGVKRFYTPVVLRMAEEHAIDLNSIQGTGAHGRVTRRDVERAIADPDGAPSAGGPPGVIRSAVAGQPASQLLWPRATHAAPVAPATSEPPPAACADAAETERGLTPMRRAIAEHMVRARAEIPDAWSLVEIDVTPLVRYRALHQAAWQAREGYELTYLPFFIKAVVAGLRTVPELNATWGGDHLTLHSQYNLGIAVSLEGGLVVPVLRGADQLSVAGIAQALRAIVLKARGGKLSLDDLQGATFTVNNPGSLGSIMSQPIVPLGQAGIVTMEAIVKRPVVTADDAIAIRSMMNSALSFDHRVLDGGGALAFLREIKRQIETVEYPVY